MRKLKKNGSAYRKKSGRRRSGRRTKYIAFVAKEVSSFFGIRLC